MAEPAPSESAPEIATLPNPPEAAAPAQPPEAATVAKSPEREVGERVPEAKPLPPSEPEVELARESPPESRTEAPPGSRPEAPRSPPAPRQLAMVFPAEPLAYAAPGPDDPTLVRLRAPTVVRGGGTETPRIQALAPEHVGLTAEAAPTLYWTISPGTEQRIEIVVSDERDEKPLVDQSLDGAREGVHALPLSRLGVELERGVTYRWYASIVPDPDDRTSEVVSGGAIRRVPLDPGLAKELAASEAGRRAHLLAQAGLFYDALDTVSTWVTRHPDAPEPRNYRRSLLAAVGLGSVLPGESSGMP
jgi:hypothetical protein